MKISRRTLLRAIPPLALAACGASKFSSSGGIQFGVPPNLPWPSGYTRRMNMLVGKQGTIQAGDIIDVMVNLSALVTAGKLIELVGTADQGAYDLMLAYHHPNGTIEQRPLHIVNSSTIRFRAVANIASGKNDHNYYLYYGWRNIGIERLLLQEVSTFTMTDLPGNPIINRSGLSFPYQSEPSDVWYDAATGKYHVFAATAERTVWTPDANDNAALFHHVATAIDGPWTSHAAYPTVGLGPIGSPGNPEYRGTGLPNLVESPTGELWLYGTSCAQQYPQVVNGFANVLYRFPNGLDGAPVRDAANPLMILGQSGVSSWIREWGPCVVFAPWGVCYMYYDYNYYGVGGTGCKTGVNGKTGWTDHGQLPVIDIYSENGSAKVVGNRIYYFGSHHNYVVQSPFDFSIYRSAAGDGLTFELLREKTSNLQDDTWNHGTGAYIGGCISLLWPTECNGHFGVIYGGNPGASYGQTGDAYFPPRLGIKLADRPNKVALGGAAHSIAPIFGNEETA